MNEVGRYEYTDPSHDSQRPKDAIHSLPMSLYRTYRPHVFADVYGQDHIITTLEKATESDALSHAYLFAGSRGTGKTSVARILAKTLMIHGIEDETLRQQIIKGVEDGSIVDLLEIDAASNRGIDDVRELIEKIQFSPVVASAKVYIIDEVHMLTKEAFNALLKTLEEPPAYAYFILATTELNKIPTTIQSRCQCFPFRHIREEDIVRRLQFISDQEKITIDREALRAIAKVSDGGMRDAISLLDQMRSLETITVEDVQKRIGISGQEYIEDIIEALEAKDKATLISLVSKIEEAGIPMDVFLRHLLTIVRQSLHASIAEGKEVSGLMHMLNTLLHAVSDTRSAPVPGLVVEAALLSLCGSDTGTSDSATLIPPAKEEKPQKSASSTEEIEEVVEKKVEDVSRAALEAPEVRLEAVTEAWPRILKEVTPASVKMSLKNGRVMALKGTTVFVGFSSSFHRDKVQDVHASRAVEELLHTIFKTPLTIQCELEGGSKSGEEGEVVNLADAAAEIF